MEVASYSIVTISSRMSLEALEAWPRMGQILLQVLLFRAHRAGGLYLYNSIVYHA
jgi:hypothetical protein